MLVNTANIVYFLIYVCAAINLHLFFLLPDGGGGWIPFCEGGGTSVTVSPVAEWVKAYRFPFLQVGQQQVRKNSS
jgi:hypothetical protein